MAPAAGLRRWFKLPLRIGQPPVELKHRLRVAGVLDGHLNCWKFDVPFIDLDATDVLFGPRLVVDPDVAIGMEEEQRFFPSRSRLAKWNKESPEFVLWLTRFNGEWICLAEYHGGTDLAHRWASQHLFDPGCVLGQAKGPFRRIVDAPARQVNAHQGDALAAAGKVFRT